jgi:hypothetical protein
VTTNPAEVTIGTVIPLYVQALRARRPIRLKVTGLSMLPAIWPGDTLTVAPIDSAALLAGAIVLKIIDGRPFVHRLVRIRSTNGRPAYETRGDTLECADPEGEIVGIVTARNGRPLLPADGFRHRLTRAIMPSAIGGTLARVFLEVRRLYRAVRRSARWQPGVMPTQ